MCHILPLFAAKRIDISEKYQTTLYKQESAEGEEIYKAEGFTCLPSAWEIIHGCAHLQSSFLRSPPTMTDVYFFICSISCLMIVL